MSSQKVVRCSNCNTLNRIHSDRSGFLMVCGECKAHLFGWHTITETMVSGASTSTGLGPSPRPVALDEASFSEAKAQRELNKSRELREKEAMSQIQAWVLKIAFVLPLIPSLFVNPLFLLIYLGFPLLIIVATIVALNIGELIKPYFLPAHWDSMAQVSHTSKQSLEKLCRYETQMKDWERSEQIWKEEQQRREQNRRKEQQRREADYWLKLGGFEFEKEIGKLFEKFGYSVTVTKGSGDEGIDVLLRRNNQEIGVQCKNHLRPVGPASLREFWGSLKHHSISKGLFIASSGFTKGAKDFAAGKPIVLADVNDIVDWQKNAPPSLC